MLSTLPDDYLLRRSTELGRILFSQDSDLIREARAFQERGEPFAGVVYALQLQVTIGICVRDLSDLAKHLEPEDMANLVYPRRSGPIEMRLSRNLKS